MEKTADIRAIATSGEFRRNKIPRNKPRKRASSISGTTAADSATVPIALHRMEGRSE